MSMFVDYARSTELYKALCLSMDSPHGNLLERTSDETAEAQTEFLRWALHLSQPRLIAEAGTNKGMFAYFLGLVWQNATLYTFDIDPQCQNQIDLFSAGQHRILACFHRGDTRDTLSHLRKYTERIDFAWIDGGHEHHVALSDLLNCASLGVPFIAVDDTIDAHEPGETDVKRAVDEFCKRMTYKLVPNPFAKHDSRGAVLLGRQT